MARKVKLDTFRKVLNALEKHVAGRRWLGYQRNTSEWNYARCKDGHCPLVALGLALLPRKDIVDFLERRGLILNALGRKEEGTARNPWKGIIWNSEAPEFVAPLGIDKDLADRIMLAADASRGHVDTLQARADRIALDKALTGKPGKWLTSAA